MVCQRGSYSSIKSDGNLPGQACFGYVCCLGRLDRAEARYENKTVREILKNLRIPKEVKLK